MNQFNNFIRQNFYSIKNVIPNSCSPNEVSKDFIYKQLTCLNPNKSICPDNISPKVLKYGADILKLPVTAIINLCISPNVVADELKSAMLYHYTRKIAH